MGQHNEENEKRRNRRMIIFAIIGIMIIGLAIGVYILEKYGKVKLSPGEHYTINIPFTSITSKSPVIEGYATYTNGTPVKNVNVTVKYYKNDSVLAWNLTDDNGYYKIILPEIKKDTIYEVYVGYENSTLKLASNDYKLNLGTNKEIYSKSSDSIVYINGTIDNEDAKIVNGRMDVNLKYCNGTFNESAKTCKGTPGKWEEIFDYKRYYVNIDPNDAYEIPSDEVNITWEIPNDAAIGKYKFEVKTSFNAKEYTKSIYFNITA